MHQQGKARDAKIAGAAQGPDSSRWARNISAVVFSGVVATGGICSGSPMTTARRARQIAPIACWGQACPASSIRSQPMDLPCICGNMRANDAKVVDTTGTSRKNMPQSCAVGGRARELAAMAFSDGFSLATPATTKARCRRMAARNRASRASRKAPPFQGAAFCKASSDSDQKPGAG